MAVAYHRLEIAVVLSILNFVTLYRPTKAGNSTRRVSKQERGRLLSRRPRSMGRVGRVKIYRLDGSSGAPRIEIA